jgi:hypothetical protein
LTSLVDRNQALFSRHPVPSHPIPTGWAGTLTEPDDDNADIEEEFEMALRPESPFPAGQVLKI